jgi:phospholipase/lecithinase/hemolysin
MASSKYPHQMPFTEYVEWAKAKIVAPDGRISRAGVAEVRRDLISRVGYLSTTPDEKAVQKVIKLLDPSVDLTTEAVQQLESIATSASETITQEGNEMAAQSTSTTTTPTTAPGLKNVRGMNAIASTAEGRIALQRWRNGQDLDPAQRRLVDDYRALEKAHNDAADASRVSKEPRKDLSTYIPGDVMPWATNQNKVQRLQQAAEHRVKVLNNPDHPYWNASSGEHKSAVLGMKIAQEMLQNGGDSFVQINDDGSIEE